jgi:PREDICTED: similar to CDC16 cell division cycle 16 homolog (S. cerevisiae)
LLSAICLLKGKIFEELDDRGEAVEWFKKALMFDVYCFEALDSLVQHQMLTRQEGRFTLIIKIIRSKKLSFLLQKKNLLIV